MGKKRRRRNDGGMSERRGPKQHKRVLAPFLANSEMGSTSSEEEEKKKKKKAKYALLSAAERKSEAYRRVSPHSSTWKPPSSSHNLLQEEHSFDHWRVLIICLLLNVTTGKQVRNVLPDLFHLCPDVETTTRVSLKDIEKVIQSLGLQRRRAKFIKRFSYEYLWRDWTHVTQLYGIGKYAADAYAIFCAGKPEQVIPNDHKLVDYWKFICGKKDEGESITIQG